MKKLAYLSSSNLIFFLIFTSLLFSVSINTIAAQNCTGDISLTSQQEVNNFNCTTIEGSLTIQGEDITDLSPLTGLIAVGGDLNIEHNDLLTNIDGLSSLTSVGESIRIRYNDALTNIDGFNNINQLGESIYIWENGVLSNIDGLVSLTSIEENLEIKFNPFLSNNLHGLINITTVGNNLDINGIAGLENLSGLSNLESVGKHLVILNCHGLTNLEGLSKLSFLGGSLNIANNNGLINLNGLDMLSSVGLSLAVQQCDGLTDLSGLENITTVAYGLRIYENDALISLNGLDNITSIGNKIDIQYNSVLNDLGALEQITSLGGNLRIDNNDALINFNGLNNITSVEGHVLIQYNDALISFEGLDNLISIGEILVIEYNEVLENVDNLTNLTSVGARVYIGENSTLNNLDGLIHLSSVGGSLIIYHNNVLTNLDGLAGLTLVGENLLVEGNPYLTNGCGIYHLLCSDPPSCTLDSVVGDISISYNYIGCNSPEEIIAAGPCSIKRIYVDQNCSSPGAGNSWENAFLWLSYAIQLANEGDTIWVADGVYFPTWQSDRNISFVLEQGVTILGGFQGNETAPEQRDIALYETILSGDIGVEGESNDNSYHVVYTLGTDSTAVLDGFTITAGHAVEEGNGNFDYGGGLLVDTDELHPITSPTIKNCTFINNKAQYGGAIHCNGQNDRFANPKISFCNFFDNHAISTGGAINKNGAALPDQPWLISDCIFENNSANLEGGAVYLFDLFNDHYFIRCDFVNNASILLGGGIYLEYYRNNGTAKIQDCNFVYNSGGGGFALTYSGFETSDYFDVNFSNTVFQHNMSSLVEGGGGITISTGKSHNTIQVNHCEFIENNGASSGGLFLYIESGGNVTLNVKRSKFINNQTSGQLGGGILYKGSQSYPGKNKMTITNSLFAFNDGAVSYESGNPGVADGLVKNCTFFNNGLYPISKNWSADFDYVNYYNLLKISNCIIWEPGQPLSHIFYNGSPDNAHLYDYTIHHNLISTASCDLPGGDEACGEGNIFDLYPAFLDTLNMDFRVVGCSPAINAGFNAGLDTLGANFDLGGEIRILEEVVDMGAYEIESLSLAVDSLIHVSCYGGSDASVFFSINGALPFSYEWENEFMTGSGNDFLSAGEYLFTVSDQYECSDIISIEITQPDSISVVYSTNPISEQGAVDGSIVLDNISGGTPPFTYFWNTNETTASISGLEPGFYYLIIRDANGCEALLTFEVKLFVANNLPDWAKNPFKIFPNPVKSELYIESESGWNSITLFDYFGRQVRQWNSDQPPGKNKLDFSGLPSGTYLLYIRSNNGLWVEKVINFAE